MQKILRSILIVMVLSLAIAVLAGCQFGKPAACEHEIVTDAGVEATCTKTGLTEGSHCAKCGEVLVEQVETDLAPHTKEVIPGVKPTCTEGGKSDGEKCSDCKKVLKEQTDLPPLGHSGGKATCQQKATCETCNQPYGELAGHTEQLVPGTAATCTKAGLTDGKKCADCHVTLEEQKEIEAIGHKGGTATCKELAICETCQQPYGDLAAHTEKVVTGTAATCTTPGKKDGKVCSECGETLLAQEVIDAKGHTEVVDAAVQATCTKTGLTEGKHCSDCNDILVAQVETGKLPHTYSSDSDTICDKCGYERDCLHPEKETVTGYAATCTKAGLTDGEKCKSCGEILVAQQEISVLPHTEVIDNAVESTCTKTGLTEGKHCSVCSTVIVKQETTDKKAHTEQAIPAVAATCTKTGLTAGKKCSVCGEILVAQTTTDALGHTEKVIPGTAATCTKTGLTDGKQCSVCNVITVEQKVTEKAAHTEEIIPAVAATCTKTGLSEGKKCSVCGEILVAQAETPVAAHTEEIIAGKDATCSETGLTEGKQCSVCKTIIVEQTVIDKVAHTEETVAGKDATCSETGLTEGKKCSVCKTIIVEQTVIDKKAHTEETLAGTAATCTETGLTDGKKCTVCGETTLAQETIAALGHAWVQDSDKVRHCSVCNYSLSTLSGKLTTEHYDNLLSSIEVYVEDGGVKYTGTVESGKWSLEVPSDLFDITVVIHDTAGRFHDINMTYAMVDTNERAAEKLVPVMTKYDLWSEYNNTSVPEQNALILNSDGSYSIAKTESGLALNGNDWWGSITTGATFSGVSSNFWVIETEIVLDEGGAWSQWQAGLMVGEKEFIIIQDRDRQLAAWTEWNNAANASGGWTDLITDREASAAGISRFTNWASSGTPMKITAVRDDSVIYIFLKDRFIGKYDITDSVFPNINGSNTNHLGFMVKSGTQATFSNYWYELGEENVDAYLAGKKVSAPTVNVVDADGTTVDGANVQYYKEVLVSTDTSTDPYTETVEWQLATKDDMILGNNLKAVFAPIELTEGTCVYTGVSLNGVAGTLSDSSYTFYLTENNSFVLTAMLNVPVDSVITAEKLDGVRLTLTNTADASDIRTLVVTNSKFTVESVYVGTTFSVTAEVAGMQINLGDLTISGKTGSYDSTSSVTSGSNSADFGANSYVVSGSDMGVIRLDGISGTIPSGDVYVGAKIQISAEQLSALLNDSKEAVIGIELRVGDRDVENMLWINGGNIKVLCGDWSGSEKFITSGTLTDYGKALQGDGLYFVVRYASDTGMVWTYVGTSYSNLECLRDWGTGGSDNPGYRSFDAGSQITGISLGYVHCWTGNDAPYRADVTFSDVVVSGTLEGLNQTTLLDMEKATLKWQSTSNTIDGIGYQNAKGTLSYDETTDAGKYTFDSIATATNKVSGKSFVPYIQGFSITDISAYSKITMKVFIDPTTCSEGFALTVYPYNTTSSAQTVVAGEWVELTFNISDFTKAWDTSVNGYLATVNTAALTNLGLVFMVSDLDNMTIETGFTLYISDFIVK